jgi:signal transduction histidine kinase
MARAALPEPQTLHLYSANISQTGSEDARKLPVQLPDSWNKSDRHGKWDYELLFKLTDTPRQAWGLYLPRAGNRFSVRINGQPIAQVGEFDNLRSDQAQRPHFVFLPQNSMQLGDNRLVLSIQGEKARYAGLSSVYIGPAEEVRPLFVRREILQTYGSFGIVVVALIFGLMSVGLAFKTRDLRFTLFAAACGFCAVRTSYAIVTEQPMPAAYWQMLVDMCYAGYLVCLCLFSIRILRIQSGAIMALTWGFMVATLVLVPAYALWQVVLARQIWNLSMIVYALCLVWWVISVWWRTRPPNVAPLVVAAIASIAIAIYDHKLIYFSQDGYGAFTLARYTLLFFLVAMGWFLVTHYADQAVIERQYQKQLAAELENKTLELSAQFKKNEQLMLETAINHEHKRLMQDLHDGMGLQLNTLLAMAEKGDLQQDELTGEVRTAIEQMRMLVDSAQTFDGDFDQLLGHIRYRIESRLKRCGIELIWHASYDSLKPSFSDKATMSLQRLIFELCSNVIKHAKARHVRMVIEPVPGAASTLQITFSDDGIGLTNERHTRVLGTSSIRRRLEELNAQAISTNLVQGGLQYRILIPC